MVRLFLYKNPLFLKVLIGRSDLIVSWPEVVARRLAGLLSTGFLLSKQFLFNYIVIKIFCCISALLAHVLFFHNPFASDLTPFLIFCLYPPPPHQ